MKTKTTTTTLAFFAVSLFLSASAHATMIAGWDFSQFYGSGELYVDEPGTTGYTNSLDANYSNLLLTPGAGPAAATHGTLFFDGQYGSTNVNPTSATAQLTPTDGSLDSNINAPQTEPGFVPFNDFAALDAAGQGFEQNLALQIQSTVTFVFAAYMDTVPGLVSDWSISLGGKTLGGEAMIDFSFSIDGGLNFVSAGSRTLNTTDSLFTVTLPGLPSSDSALIRMTVNKGSSTGPQIDNVSISGNVASVPLPGVAILLGTALAAFALVGRKRMI